MSVHQIIAHAPSWVANPAGITEQASHDAEPDERVWRREYLAVPQEARLAVFPAELIDRSFGAPPPFEHTGRRVLVMDPSSGRKDSWTWSMVSWVRERVERPAHAVSERLLVPCDGLQHRYRYVDGPWKVQAADGSWSEVEVRNARTLMLVEVLEGVEGRFYDQVAASDIVQRIADLARSYGIVDVHSDQREEYALKSLFREAGLVFHVHPWTGGDAGLKSRMVSALRRRFAEGTIHFPKHDRLRRELLSFEEQITPSGALTFGARGNGHDDYVACVLTAQAVEIEGGTYPNFRTEGPAR